MIFVSPIELDRRHDPCYDFRKGVNPSRDGPVEAHLDVARHAQLR